MMYSFEQPFEILQSGQEITVESIDFKAPTSRQCFSLGIIDKEYNKALFELSKLAKDNNQTQQDSAKSEDDSEKAKTIIQVMELGGSDFGKCVDAMVECLSGTAKYNGEIKVNKTLLGDMPYKQSKQLLGEFVANFISSSL